MILAINTASFQCEVSLVLFESSSVQNSTRTISWSQNGKEADELLVKIKELLQSEAKKFHEIKELLVATGPGPFSSLRIGISAANVLSYALGIPLNVIDNFDLYQQAYNADVILIRANRHSVFFKRKSQHQPQILSLAQCAQLLKSEQLIAAGDLYIEQRQFFLEQDIQILSTDHCFEKLFLNGDPDFKKVEIADASYYKDANISLSKTPLSFIE